MVFFFGGMTAEFASRLVYSTLYLFATLGVVFFSSHAVSPASTELKGFPLRARRLVLFLSF